MVERNWVTGRFWFALVLNSPTGLFAVFYDQIKPLFWRPNEMDPIQQVMPWYWSKDMVSTLQRKLKDKEQYDTELLLAFRERSTDDYEGKGLEEKSLQEGAPEEEALEEDG